MATSYLTRAAQTASSNTTMTISLWFKRSKIGSGTIWMHENQASHNAKLLLFFSGTNDQISMQSYNGSAEYVLTPTRKFRDLSSWYHVTAVWNTTVATTADRMQIWVNGVRETSFSTANYPSRNHEIDLSNKAHQIGRYGSSGGYSNYWDGLMSQFILVDGQAYDASKFAEIDSVTGEWKAKTNPTGITYGNRGVWLKMENSSNLGLDSSGKNNNYTNGGVIRTLDNPSNSFCSYNPNYKGTRKDLTLANGNNFIAQQNSGDSSVSATMAISSGKYYWETRIAQINGTNAAVVGGMHTTEDYNTTPTDVASENNTCGLRSNGNAHKNGVNLGNFTAATYNNDIFGVGFDGDNGAVYFWRNGTALNSGNAVITGLDMSKTWMPFGICHGGARVSTSTNFGNGYFQATAISSAGTNASGNGVFEYNVPSGYTALSTKGLNL